MAYATPADLVARFDARDIGQLVSDDKIVVSTYDLNTNVPCLVALSDAAGEIEAALLVGNRYTVVDLQTLSANSNSLLVRMNCDVAMRNLCSRRFGWNPEKAKAIRELADTQLEKLRNGENAFNIQLTLDSAEPVVDGPTMADFVTGPNALNLIRDRVHNFYPPRWLPRGRN
jgi:phage gp36-like protein